MNSKRYRPTNLNAPPHRPAPCSDIARSHCFGGLACGRVAAVSGLFIGASAEFGEFETGVVVRFLGPVGAVVFGGVGSLVVTGA
jgi:hypothetical protein